MSTTRKESVYQPVFPQSLRPSSGAFLFSLAILPQFKEAN